MADNGDPMTKDAFLEELKEALDGNVSPALLNENIRYYDEYIETERLKGRSEGEILYSLGDPRLIARTIIDTADAGDRRGYDSSGAGTANGSYEDYDDDLSPEGKRPNISYKRIQGWKVLAVIAAILIIFLLVFTLVVFLVGSFIAAFWPAIIVAFIIWWILNPMRFE